MIRRLIILLLIVGCEEVLDNLNPDITAPTVLITSPVNESTLTATTSIKVDVSDDSDIFSVKFLIDGTEAYADTTAPYEYEWDVCVLGTGSHSVLVKAEDSSGNEGQSDISTFTLNASYDCESVCGGNKLLDNCEVCDADSTNDCDKDCNNVWGGDALEDDCGVCDNDNTNDCVQDECGSWGGDGILLWEECYSIGQTTTINQLQTNLQGKISPKIGNLINLTKLVLSGHAQLNGEIPSEIGNLVNLTELNLSGNRLSGEIPSEIGNLVNLTELNLSTNLFTQVPSEIATLVNLKELHLYDNQLTSLPQNLCDLPTECSIVVSSNKLCEEYHYTCIAGWGSDLTAQDQSNCCEGENGEPNWTQCP